MILLFEGSNPSRPPIMTNNENEELIFLRTENNLLKETLKISNKNWKFENERLQLSLDGALQEITRLAKLC